MRNPSRVVEDQPGRKKDSKDDEGKAGRAESTIIEVRYWGRRRRRRITASWGMEWERGTTSGGAPMASLELHTLQAGAAVTART